MSSEVSVLDRVAPPPPARLVRRASVRRRRPGTARFVLTSAALHACVLGALAAFFPETLGVAPVVAEVSAVFDVTPPDLAPEVEELEPVDLVERPTEVELDEEPPPVEMRWAPETSEPEDDRPAVISVTDRLSRTPGTRGRRRGSPQASSGDGNGSVVAAAPATRAPVVVSVPPAPPRERVSTPVKLLSAPRPDYPTAAREAGVEGVVHLDVEVLEDGTVGEVDLVGSSGSGALDRAAVAAVRRWTFRPATEDGTPVRRKVRLPAVRFRIE